MCLIIWKWHACPTYIRHCINVIRAMYFPKFFGKVIAFYLFGYTFQSRLGCWIVDYIYKLVSTITIQRLFWSIIFRFLISEICFLSAQKRDFFLFFYSFFTAKISFSRQETSSSENSLEYVNTVCLLYTRVI